MKPLPDIAQARQQWSATDGDKTQLTGTYVLAAESPVFAGHFPGMPLVPGVYQLAALVDLVKQWSKIPKLRLQGVKKVKWTNPVLPGQEMKAAFTVRTQREGLIEGSGHIEVEGRTVCQASLSLVTVSA